MTLIEGLLISISLCLNAFLLIYIQLTASIILFYYNKIKNLENINKDFENKNKYFENENKDIQNKIEAVGFNDEMRAMNIY
jgi:hypothetical protein